MTQEDKQLLLKDLCGRLPYGVKCKMWSGKAIEHSITETLRISGLDAFMCNDSFSIKPYLRPMSFMTEREKEVLQYIAGGKILDNCNCIVRNGFGLYYDNIAKIGDWLNEHHFDYRGLISMGLALEATEDIYKID